jgi:MFS family permease
MSIVRSTNRVSRHLSDRFGRKRMYIIGIAAIAIFTFVYKLRVEGLPVGADAGIAEEPFFGVSFGHILCKR